MMQDGKALQSCTTHNLGQNFSKSSVSILLANKKIPNAALITDDSQKPVSISQEKKIAAHDHNTYSALYFSN